MKESILIMFAAVFFVLACIFFSTNLTSTLAQTTDVQKMPDVVTLGKEAKLGPVTFNHVKHNGGTYSMDQAGPIQCISCHHTGRPAAEIAKTPPLNTAWPADRTTTLTAELFTKDPKGSGVAACRDCHARTGEKPKLLLAIPEIKHESSAALITVTNQQAFHRTCAGCHAEAKKTRPALKAPSATACVMCHKRTAA